jgi:hypothetical protein
VRCGPDGIEARGLLCDLGFEVVVVTAMRWVGELVMGMRFQTVGPGGIFLREICREMETIERRTRTREGYFSDF